MYARLAMSFFCTFERSYSSVLRPILLKLHILTRLIESFPVVHGSWSCIEIEMLIPQGALAGPALFRGRLRAFGKCTNGVAFSKGRPN